MSANQQANIEAGVFVTPVNAEIWTPSSPTGEEQRAPSAIAWAADGFGI